MNTNTVGTGASLNTPFKPNGTFASTPYFDCNNDTFCKAMKGRKKGGHWNTFIGKNEFTDNIKQWMKNNKNNSFILRNVSDNTMIFAHKK